jgi:hypothetical protein
VLSAWVVVYLLLAPLVIGAALGVIIDAALTMLAMCTGRDVDASQVKC